ncbi:cytochrome P450 9e2-like [Schistocerca gregaria]|uniref:cytochrome P450 9e2-like n=1 Tax=Schistocerca gregaria TaxID=7010 RepID=UPI00211EC52D|nr:cytochrome P450 9e2-like [Schistocerca gregaria]
MAADWCTLLAPLAVGAAAAAAAALALWWRRCSTHFARRGLPSIHPLPLVGNMLDLVLRRKSMADTLTELYRKFEPHPYAGVYFTTPFVMVRDPDIIRAITVKDFDHFTDHMEFFNADKSNTLAQRMLTGLKGKEWHGMRTTLSPAFTTMKMKSMFTLMTEIGHQAADYLAMKAADYEASSGDRDLLTLEMKDFFTRVTNDVIATTAFGVKVDSLSEPDNTFYRMGRDVTNIGSLVAGGFMTSPKLMQLLGISFFDRKAMEFFKSMVYETIHTREKHGIVRPDVIHLLMQASRGELVSEECKKDGTTGSRDRCLSDEDVAAQVILFFFAGFESVATLLTFCSYLLATHEDVQKRLQREVDELMQKSAGQPSYEQVLGCQYLDMVLAETLRMYVPGTALDRVCVRSYQLPAADGAPGVWLHPGDVVWVPVHAIHRDPKYFPEPERFDPERFSPENKHLIKPFTYFPFGSGPRICIGQRFALMEAKVVLVHLLSRFSLQVVEKTPVPVKIQPSSITLSIQGGAWLGMRRRAAL